MGVSHDHVFEREHAITNRDFPHVIIRTCGNDRENMFKFMDVEEIAKLTDRFFKEYGFGLSRKRIVQITFCPEMVEMENYVENWSGESRYAAGDSLTWQLEDKKTKVGIVNIYFNNISSMHAFVEVLIHELDHVLWAYENKEFDRTMDYDERPHEKRACSKAKLWVKDFAKTTT